MTDIYTKIISNTSSLYPYEHNFYLGMFDNKYVFPYTLLYLAFSAIFIYWMSCSSEAVRATTGLGCLKVELDWLRKTPHGQYTCDSLGCRQSA